MELVEKNILPVESSLKEALIGEEAQHPECIAGRRRGAGVGQALGFFALRLFALTWGLGYRV